MPDHSGLATPKILCTPLLFYQRGGSPIGQGGEAGMKPREGKHASNPKTRGGFRGGIPPPRGGLSTPRGAPWVLCSHPSGARRRRRPRLCGGLCSLPQVASGRRAGHGAACQVPPAKPQGLHLRAVQVLRMPLARRRLHPRLQGQSGFSAQPGPPAPEAASQEVRRQHCGSVRGGGRCHHRLARCATLALVTAMPPQLLPLPQQRSPPRRSRQMRPR